MIKIIRRAMYYMTEGGRGKERSLLGEAILSDPQFPCRPAALHTEPLKHCVLPADTTVEWQNAAQSNEVTNTRLFVVIFYFIYETFAYRFIYDNYMKCYRFLIIFMALHIQIP